MKKVEAYSSDKSSGSYRANASAIIRILTDLSEIQNDNTLDIEVEASEDSFFKWDVTFAAPNGRAVKAEIHFDKQNQYAAPKMIIKSKLFHPNISDEGEVCLQCLKENWAARNSIWSLIVSVQALLSDPSPQDPVNAHAANLLLEKPEEYHELASQCFNELDSFERVRKYLPDNASPEHSPEDSLGLYQGIASPEHSLKPVQGGETRILTDLTEIQNDNMLDIEVEASKDSIFEWNVTFPAPNGKNVKAVLHFDSQYPYSAPKMVIKSKLFHPNISDRGEVCLHENWNPTMSTWAFILSVQALLDEPNPYDPANAHAANLLLNDPEAYQRMASLCFDALGFSIFHNDDRSLDLWA